MSALSVICGYHNRKLQDYTHADSWLLDLILLTFCGGKCLTAGRCTCNRLAHRVCSASCTPTFFYLCLRKSGDKKGETAVWSKDHLDLLISDVRKIMLLLWPLSECCWVLKECCSRLWICDVRTYSHLEKGCWLLLYVNRRIELDGLY